MLWQSVRGTLRWRAPPGPVQHERRGVARAGMYNPNPREPVRAGDRGSPAALSVAAAFAQRLLLFAHAHALRVLAHAGAGAFALQA